MKNRGRIRKRRAAAIVALVVITAVLVYFVQFTALGYRVTVPLRGFSAVASNVYVHRGFTGDIDQALRTVDDARSRVAAYFGEIRSDPIVIMCDDSATIAKLGGDHDTTTAVLFGAHSYISVSSEFLNVDVIAHELTHAETHARLYKGKLWNGQLVPVWFDEGVALQNDHRERYDEDAWKEATGNGENVVALSDIDTVAEFYAGESEQRRYRYIVSKHELSGWIALHGVDALLELLDEVNRGGEFSRLYFN